MARNAVQAPGELLDYTIDYSNELDYGSPPDTIQTSSWTITAGLGATPPVLTAHTFNGPYAYVCVSELVHGNVYSLTNQIATAQGLTFDRTITIRCHEVR